MKKLYVCVFLISLWFDLSAQTLADTVVKRIDALFSRWNIPTSPRLCNWRYKK